MILVSIRPQHKVLDYGHKFNVSHASSSNKFNMLTMK